MDKPDDTPFPWRAGLALIAIIVAAGFAPAHAATLPGEPPPNPTHIVAEQVVESVRGPAVAVYVAAVHDAQLGAFYAAVEQRRVEASAAALRARGARASSSTSSTPAGGHSDAWWHGVAQCEQGGRNDSYYGYFSFMDGSQGGRPWDEQVAAGNALLARAGHEVGPWAASCVNAGYRASPGG